MKKSQFKLYYWLSLKLLFNRSSLFGGSGVLALLGLILGVSTLVVSQSVMRGFESTLKSAVIDATSDLQVVRRGRMVESWPHFVDEVKKSDPSIQKMTRFSSSEAVLAYKGKVSGVLVQGVDLDEVEGVLNLKKRIVRGELPTQMNEIAIGQGLASKYALDVGQKAYIAVPISTPFESNKIQREAEEFTVKGVVDFGKNDWNERLVLSNLKAVQKLTKIGDRFTGAYVKIEDSSDVVEVSSRVTQALEPKYYVNNWYNINRNLIEAVHLEKIVIFIVVFLIVIMAAFNISSALYVVVRARMPEISILKTVGFSSKNIRLIFIIQGFLIGTFSTVMGFLFGLILCYGFQWLQSRFGIISGAVYKLDRIDIQISFVDFIYIYLATLVACIAAAYYPAKRASQLSIVDGFRTN